MMVGLLDVHTMSSGHASCRCCNAAVYTWHMVCTALSICSLTRAGCMKLTNADDKKIAFATWCVRCVMLVSSIGCALWGYSRFGDCPGCIHQNHTKHIAIFPTMHHLSIFSHSHRILTQFHALQTLSYRDHMCLSVQSPLVFTNCYITHSCAHRLASTRLPLCRQHTTWLHAML